MVVPVATGKEEMLTLLRRRGSELESTAIAPCRFVPLIGAEVARARSQLFLLVSRGP